MNKAWLARWIGIAGLGVTSVAAASDEVTQLADAGLVEVELGFGVSDEAAQLADAGSCISHRAEARFRTGYDHLVHVENRCDRAARCSVSTNVNPTPIAVTVAPRTTETVLTFRGSPAREFTARVSCTLE